MNKRSIFKNIGILLSVIAFGSAIVHRFSNPDMTDVRWIIEYWYVELFMLLVSGLGLFIWFRNTQ